MADEKNNKGNHPEGCMCMGCRNMGMGGGMGMMGGRWNRPHWTFFLLRTLIMILIIVVVFWFGVQVGRLTSYGHGGYMMMDGGYGYGRAYPVTGYNPGGPMIRAGGATSSPMMPTQAQ